jgi:hypothetical protein
MACNCKKTNEFQDKYGKPEEESAFQKSQRYIYKIMIFAVAVLLAIVVTPVIVMTAIYKMIFKNNESIVLPEFLSKYMR